MDCCGNAIPLNCEVKTYLKELASKLPEINKIIDLWGDYSWPYYFEDNIIMFHAPVGNTYILSPTHKVKVFMSGFCVSGEAGIKYVADVIKRKHDYTSPWDAANNSFNTWSMMNGISKIVDDLGIDKLLEIDKKNIFKISNREDSQVLLTQALCPIVVQKSWAAKKVWSALKHNNGLRCYASLSLESWLDNLYKFCDLNTKIILFGKAQNINCDGTIKWRNTSMQGSGELIKLLMCSFKRNGKVIITNSDQGKSSIYDEIVSNFEKNIFVVPHPAFYDVNRSKYLIDQGYRRVV